MIKHSITHLFITVIADDFAKVIASVANKTAFRNYLL